MQKIEQAARRRIQSSSHQQQQTIAAVRQGRPLEAEFDPERAASRLQSESFVTTMAVLPSVVGALETVGGAPGGAERIWGNTVDFVGVAFLQQGAQAARAVGCVACIGGSEEQAGTRFRDSSTKACASAPSRANSRSGVTNSPRLNRRDSIRH